MKKINLLSKAEMKSVMGGLVDPGTGGGSTSDVCYIMVTKGSDVRYELAFNEGAGNGVATAQADCANYIKQGGDGTKCQYDCGYDGFSASWIQNFPKP